MKNSQWFGKGSRAKIETVNPSSLTLQALEFPYSIPEKQVEATHEQTEFFIDGEPLAKRLTIEAVRPWFGRTGFENTLEGIEHFAKELLAEQEPINQFGRGRLVLYRCHCGSDYCGIISCQVVREDKLVHWLDIREESDEDDAENHSSVKIDKISFDFQQYQEEIMAFVESRTVNEQSKSKLQTRNNRE